MLPGTSHVFDVKKWMPSFENAGHASCVVENAMRPRMISTEKPASSATDRNAVGDAPRGPVAVGEAGDGR